ncbi:MAG: phosphoribosylformylglycinamidine synthase I [Fimbriimonadaceae bacterium]|nr:phosphoribosylformylglycinamidine synthase I [Fimbriimonadaceae bacterium]
MRVAVLRFPGANCDQDALWALREDIGVQAEYVWHEDHSLNGFDAVFVPGGFTYGDYLRCGAIASRAAIMEETVRFANDGGPVIGVCNGFQVLCEAGLLPGALLLNDSQKFVCEDVYLKAINTTSMWTAGVDRVLRIPVAHGEGRYVCDNETWKMLRDENRIAFQYCSAAGDIAPESNPNGSAWNIAGILNRSGNVLGMMPHPERATKGILGSEDGKLILNALSVVKAGV